MNRYQHYYTNIISYDLLFKDHFLNPMQLPKLAEISLNIGLGSRAVIDKKQVILSLSALQLITGQKACMTYAHKSVDQFKLRQNMPIGSKVSLRKYFMYRFIDNFVHTCLPMMDQFDQDQEKNIAKAKKQKKTQGGENTQFYPLGTSRRKGGENEKRSAGKESEGSIANTRLFQEKDLQLTTKETKNFSSNNSRFSFGFSDYFLFRSLPYSFFGSFPPYGLNFNVRVVFPRKRKSNHLFFPFYFFSCFHLPFLRASFSQDRR